MRKIKGRIVSFIVCIVLFASLLPTTILEAGNNDAITITGTYVKSDVEYKVDLTMDQTVVAPGDTVTFHYINKTDNKCFGISSYISDENGKDLSEYFETSATAILPDVFTNGKTSYNDIYNGYLRHVAYTNDTNSYISGNNEEIYAITYKVKEDLEITEPVELKLQAKSSTGTASKYYISKIASYSMTIEGTLPLTIVGSDSEISSSSFAPTFSPGSGTTIEFGEKVFIESGTEGVKIYYTTDGTDPDPDSSTGCTEYTVPIIVTEDMTIKAIAVNGSQKSKVVEASYTVEYPKNQLCVNAGTGYGGTVTRDPGDVNRLTFTATNGGNYNYVIDQIFVDGVPLKDPSIQGRTEYLWDPESLGDATGVHSVVATFAYTVNFQKP